MEALLQLLLSLLVLGDWGAAAVEVTRPRGVSLSNRHFYDETKPFTCLDGSATIVFDRVNDDYCDCADGSDEPGTPACPNGKFHCTNAGYRPQYIPSSRVNDGICDCCDGTDEFNSGVVCENTCKEKGRKARETLQQLAEVSREGFRLKQELIEGASKGREEKRGKVTELQQSKASLEEQVELLKAKKEAAEKPEQEAKSVHQKAWDELKEVQKAEKEQARGTEAFAELDDDEDGMISVSELQSHLELDENGDGALSEDEAQALLGGIDQADVTIFHDKVWPAIKDKYKSESVAEIPPPPLEVTDEEDSDSHLDSESEPPPHDDEDYDDEEDDDDEDATEEDHKVPHPKQPTEQEAGEDKMPPYDEATQALIDEAQKARDEYEEAVRSLKDMEDSIRNLEKEISFDFGPQGEFSYLYGQCYELSTNEYVYRLCPFNRVSQKPKNGGSETNLGTWGFWAGPEDDKFSVMKYEHGTGCWQGPSRSTNVKLSCGKETVVTSTTEPSRCEYLMEFFTPSACMEPQEVDPSDHDEL
ncbi:glucosidase 2 subunit beta isoform X1 [Ambystoma mexicanum]|uniref:glucosidase 2 subunit beta isoform X1 n=1 Tax=Ambystoma mexicanum TaxID=8296 RepID=UPI0037E8DB98